MPQVSDAQYYLSKFLLSIIILLSILAPINVNAKYSDTEWLALNIYHESRGENIIGKVAVALVTINRLEDPSYPKTIKGVVTQNKQFSWYNKRKIRAIKKDGQYHICLVVAESAINIWKSKRFEYYVRQTGLNELKYYHKNTVSPYWSHDKEKIVEIGKHLFYRDV